MSEKYTDAGADISACGRYRYRLWRWWAHGPAMGFVMLNPSTADGEVDDPTIRRCIGFAKREGFGGIMVVNLFAFRATDPGDLLLNSPLNDPRAREFAEAEIRACAENGCVVAAWGAHPATVNRSEGVHSIRRVKEWAGPSLKCLGVTKSGAPRHPLYLPNDAPLVRWPVTP